MKKLVLIIGCLLSSPYLKAADLGPTIYSSYTEVDSGRAVLFSSFPVQVIGITISSSSPNSLIAFYRSTSAAFTPDISSITTVDTGYLSFNQGPIDVPFYNLAFTSYSYINKVGLAKVIYWLKCSKVTDFPGSCPGSGSFYFGAKK